MIKRYAEEYYWHGQSCNGRLDNHMERQGNQACHKSETGKGVPNSRAYCTEQRSER